MKSLFEELVLNGIIKTYPKVKLSEFLGDISYTGATLKAKKRSKEPVPGGGDVRRAIVEYCILPMSKYYLQGYSRLSVFLDRFALLKKLVYFTCFT